MPKLICCLCLGWRQAVRIMRQIISRNRETGKANALDFRLAASWACLRLPMPVLVCSYCYPARTVTRTGWFQFKLFVVSATPVSVSFSLIKKCSRHYPFGKMLRIVFVLRGVLTLVSRLPHVVSAPITISVVLAWPC